MFTVLVGLICFLCGAAFGVMLIIYLAGQDPIERDTDAMEEYHA